MRPPAQVVTLVFVCAAALIDLSMVQANRDPPPWPLTFACGRSIGVCANRWLPIGAASSLHDGARQGFDGSTECLCKLQGRSSVRHEVPAYCHYEYNRSNKRNLGTLRTPRARSAPAPLPSRSARAQSQFTKPFCAVPLAQSFCHEPSNIGPLIYLGL